MTGHFRQYKDIKFGAAALATIEQANTIIDGYEAGGYVLTLRGLYYQFVARGLFENDVKNYNRLGSLISDGRVAGLVSWTAIEDTTRNLKGIRCDKSPAEGIQRLRDSYRIDMWQDQEWRPEVWIEKAAGEGMIAGICNELHVDYFGCRGYSSQTEAWVAGQRFAQYFQKGQRPIVFHIGDHDPSGIDMTRDNRERISLFASVPVQVVRIALNMDQIDRYSPPPNPAKTTDSRFADYAAKYGDESWELDALSPDVLTGLIKDAVLRVRDEKIWEESLKRQAADIEELDLILEGLN